MGGWAVTVTAGLMSYPIDTVRRRMMGTSGGGVKYKGSMDCFMTVLKNEGFMSLMKGAGANVLRGVAGAGVLAGFDKFKAVYIEWRTAQENRNFSQPEVLVTYHTCRVSTMYLFHLRHRV